MQVAMTVAQRSLSQEDRFWKSGVNNSDKLYKGWQLLNTYYVAGISPKFYLQKPIYTFKKVL